MVYYPLRFIWDVETSEANVQRRGFDFGAASLIFDGLVLERDDLRRDYGERRVVAVGIAAGEYLTVVYTYRNSARGAVRRIISARRSNKRERRNYDKAFAP